MLRSIAFLAVLLCSTVSFAQRNQFEADEAYAQADWEYTKAGLWRGDADEASESAFTERTAALDRYYNDWSYVHGHDQTIIDLLNDARQKEDDAAYDYMEAKNNHMVYGEQHMFEGLVYYNEEYWDNAYYYFIEAHGEFYDGANLFEAARLQYNTAIDFYLGAQHLMDQAEQ